MLVLLLETLSPDERAVFVLREVFRFGYCEIAGAVGKSAATVRQVAEAQMRRNRAIPPARTPQMRRT